MSSVNQASNLSEIYEGDLQDVRPSFVPNHKHFADVDIVDFKIKPKLHSVKFYKNQEVKKELMGVYAVNSGEAAPYLDYNAPTWGDFAEGGIDLQYSIGIVKQCEKQVVVLEGELTGLKYLKTIECRKYWCPDCGGKNGRIHKHRLHSIMRRFDVDKWNLRQFVLTIPESLRSQMRERENIDKLIKYSKDLSEKFFGEPIFDRKGHVKKYKLQKGVICYLHLFGDQDRGIYKPHINLHILENREEKLKLSDSILKTIQKYWLKKLRNLDENIDVVDIHYSFQTIKAHKLHRLKYMSRPWGVDDFDKVDDDLRGFLVRDMIGFQYIRFWGALANCNYKDDYDVEEEIQSCSTIVGEKLNLITRHPFDYESWKDRLIEIGKGFYILVSKGNAYEREKSEIEKKAKGICFR